MEIFKRGRLTWIIRDDSIVVFDRIQATIYAPFLSARNHAFDQMCEALRSSPENELDNWADAILFAQSFNVMGAGTRIPRLDNC